MKISIIIVKDLYDSFAQIQKSFLAYLSKLTEKVDIIVTPGGYLYDAIYSSELFGQTGVQSNLEKLKDIEIQANEIVEDFITPRIYDELIKKADFVTLGVDLFEESNKKNQSMLN